MSSIVVVFLIVAGLIGAGVLSWYKERSILGWMLLQLFFFPSVLVLLFLPSLRDQNEEKRAGWMPEAEVRDSLISPSTAAHPPKYEYCEIERHSAQSTRMLGDIYDCFFVANAVGPEGNFLAGRSAVFRTDANSACGRAIYGLQQPLDAFVRRLIEHGWEPTGDRGSMPWNMKFRRVARSAAVSCFPAV